MKYLITIIVLSLACAAQVDTAKTCFTHEEITQIATGVKILEYQTAYKDTLILEQSKELAFMETRIKLKDTTIAALNRVIKLQKTNEELQALTNKKLEQIIANQSPSIFDNKFLWLAIGVGTGYLIFHH